jgi:FKBP-type peptidyl-prolyl cis-trans isomerase 2
MKQGDKVKVHYTGTLSDGKVFDSSEGKNPLEFEIGAKQVIPGFENGIKAMKLNEEKTIKIKAEEAYGKRDERMVVSIPKDQFKQEVQVGGMLLLKGPQGQQLRAIVTDVTKDIIKIDLNHPLAGKDLNFKVKIVGIN